MKTLTLLIALLVSSVGISQKSELATQRDMVDNTIRLHQMEIFTRNLQTLDGFSKTTTNDSLFMRYNRDMLEIADVLYTTSVSDPVIFLNNKKVARHYQIVACNNLGCKISDYGNYKVAAGYFFHALALSEQLKDSLLIGESYNNTAQMLSAQKLYTASIGHHQVAVRFSKNSQENLSTAYTCISSNYFALKQADSAFKYGMKANQIYAKQGDSSSIAISLCNLASIEYLRNDLPKALDNFKKAFGIYKNINPSGSIMMLANVAKISANLGDLKNAELYANQLKEFSKLCHSPEGTMESAMVLKKIYHGKGNCKKELEETINYYTLRDSIQNESNKKDLIKKDVQYSYDKKALTDSLKYVTIKKITDAKFIAQDSKLESEKTKRYAVLFGLLFVCIISFLLLNRFILIKKQKKLVDEKQADTMSSIRYAQTLQESILPNPDDIRYGLKDATVFYHPKDIVAGDFYWYQRMLDGTIYIAACDCTGHGVPGAMVSVVCSNALDRAVNEYQDYKPSDILNTVNTLVKKTFSKNKEVKDGMDISLICINPLTKHISWAGANNPLWYIQSGELKEIKADKQPVGNYVDTKPFTNHVIPYQEDTDFYLITDGFSDQFGGLDNKKFKSSALKEILKSIHKMNSDDQIKQLYHTFKTWKGNNEQTDDVTLIGFSI